MIALLLHTGLRQKSGGFGYSSPGKKFFVFHGKKIEKINIGNLKKKKSNYFGYKILEINV